jgi:AcrR family transcriptional regulator
MPPLRERKKLRAREHIVETAYDLFGRHGFAPVTVSDIVAAAEVSRSTFFRYFGDKQEVVFAHEHTFRAGLVAEAHAASAPAPGGLREALEQLRTLAVGAYRAASLGPRSEVHERLIDANPELLDRHIRKLMGFADDMTELLIARGAEASTARLAAHLAVGCCLAARGEATTGDMAGVVAMRFDDLLRLGNH